VPSRFNKQPLRLLDALYGFIGGQRGPTEFALESSIQPVHDLSRAAALTGLGTRSGYWLAQADMAHTGAGTIAKLLPVYDTDPAGFTNNNGWPEPLPSDLRVWVLDVYGQLSGTDSLFGEAECEISMPNAMVGPADGTTIDANDLLIATFDNGTVFGNLTLDGGNSLQAQLPVRIEPGQTLNFRSTQEGSGSMTCQMRALLWVGVLGATPAGMG